MIRSPDDLAHASCFSGSCAGLVTGFTCGTFDLELRERDVVDAVHDKERDGNRAHPAAVQSVSKFA